MNSSTIVQLVITSLIIGGAVFCSNNNTTTKSIKQEFNEKVLQYETDQNANQKVIDKYTEEILIEKGWAGTSANYKSAEKLAILKIKKQYSK